MPSETRPGTRPQRAHRQVTDRLLPQTRGNWRRLERVLESQRQLYNAALQERSDAWRLAGVSLSYIDQAKSLTVCRREIPEMAAMPVTIQRGTLKRLDDAFQGFFRRANAGQKPGSPRFRGRRRFDSISIVSGVRLEAGRLRLPGFGWMTVRRRGGTPYPDARAVSAVLRREAGRWYAVVCHAVAHPQPEDNGTVIGIDMNAGQVAASDGRLFHAPDTRRLEARAKRLSRKLARQKRGSGRRARTRARLAKTRRRQAGTRRDWHHQVLAQDRGGWAHRRDRGPEGEGHDGKRPRHGGRAGQRGEAEGRAQPGRSRHRLGRPARDAERQGGARDRGRSPPHQPDLCSVRARRRPIAQGFTAWPAATPIMRTRMLPAPYGVGDWRCCTGRLPGCRAVEP